ncbi:NAD(P)H-dependent oxidoreductase [Peribacillus simplex]|uniref:FMN dependent NADH:quinone oxidoreductase n=2 Tax=Peribacillus TaxID=2675229 RepID=A0AA90SW72_9BACI|nr:MULTISPECIES: NAD(P)H-dependent oxidoreductase [Peribacillus]MDP1418897.1 NAD(P)H-dependent oxidoreductase [Peribacillus simplex]MDP1451590.1 NAD(P)H-dependent oxidoreductase [Peribacillus frigoritolerans]
MTNVLVIKANNRPDDISTKMYEKFVEEATINTNLNVTTFDVFEENMSHYGQDLFNAFGKLQTGEELNEREAASLAAQQKAQKAISNADVLVFAFPLWKLTIPSALQSFIDYNLQAGFTFKYNEQGQKEFLLSGKKVILLNARGGFYNTPEMDAMEMSMNYMRAVIKNYFGFEIIDEVIVEGHAQDPKNAPTIIAEGLEKVKETAAKL